MKISPHAADHIGVYDYGDTVIREGDLFDKSIADKEFNGYTVQIYQFGPVVMMMVEEKEPKLRKIWHIFCCEVHADMFMKALARENFFNG